MTFGSLFSGIGGLDLGLERAGMRCVWQVEKDDYCQRVLARHWPNVRRWGDVRTFPPEGDWSCDLICGGFPCQDISGAGKRIGIEGSRSGLWHEFSRVVRLVQPRFIIVENVAAILLRGIDTVLASLAESGFDAEWDCVPACAFGAPHERERFFLVAYPREVSGRCGRILNGFHAFPRNSEWSSAQGITSGRRWKRWLNTAAAAVGGQISASDFCGMDDGLPQELDAIGRLGNAVVPQVAEWIGRRIMEAQRYTGHSGVGVLGERKP